MRIDRLYLPVYRWCLGFLRNGQAAVIGVNGPQGAGKSTLTGMLSELFRREGYRAATVSIDDFYLTREQQVLLAGENPGNPYLQNRGYPGTHDLALGTQVLREIRERSGVVSIPRYEKSLNGGKGDRMPRTSWTEIVLPLDIVFFEGWMLGFRAENEGLISDPSLVEANRRLLEYEEWWAQLDALVRLKPEDPFFVVDWRVEAEERMKAAGKPGMSEAEARAYVTGFLPAYDLYLPRLTVACPELVIEIGRDRLPIRRESKENQYPGAP